MPMRRPSAPPGTPDGILMSGVSSALSDFRSDALMPSKCTVTTFLCATRPLLADHPRRTALVSCWAWAMFQRGAQESRSEGLLEFVL